MRKDADRRGRCDKTGWVGAEIKIYHVQFQ